MFTLFPVNQLKETRKKREYEINKENNEETKEKTRNTQPKV